MTLLIYGRVIGFSLLITYAEAKNISISTNTLTEAVAVSNFTNIKFLLGMRSTKLIS